MGEFEATLCQLGLGHEVGEGIGVLHLRHADDGTAVGQQVGAHVGERTGHVVKFVAVFQLIPLIGAIGQEIVVVLAFIMLNIKEILKIVKAYSIDRKRPLGECNRCRRHESQQYQNKFFHIIEVLVSNNI